MFGFLRKKNNSMFTYGDFLSLGEKDASKIFRGEKVLFVYGRGSLFNSLQKLNRAKLIAGDLAGLKFMSNYVEILDFKNVADTSKEVYEFAKKFNELQSYSKEVEYQVFFFPEIIKINNDYKNEFLINLLSMVSEAISNRQKVIVVYDSLKSSDENTFKKIEEIIRKNSF